MKCIACGKRRRYITRNGLCTPSVMHGHRRPPYCNRRVAEWRRTTWPNEPWPIGDREWAVVIDRWLELGCP